MSGFLTGQEKCVWTESISGPGVELFFFLVAALVLRFGFRVRIKLFVFFTAKFNKGYKFLKLCRTRFGTKEGQEGTPSNTFAERKKLQHEPRLSVPFAVPALVRAGLGQDWQVLGEAGGCELRGGVGLFYVLGEEGVTGTRTDTQLR